MKKEANTFEKLLTDDPVPTQINYNDILHSFKIQDYRTALHKCQTINTEYPNAWFYCIEAELFITLNEYGSAVSAYHKAFAASGNDPLLDHYISLQLALCYLEQNELRQLLDTLETYFLFYPTKNTRQLSQTYLHYYLYLIALLQQNDPEKVQYIMHELESFDCTELQFLKIAVGFAQNTPGFGEIYEQYINYRPSHACKLNECFLMGINNFKDEADAKSFFENCVEDELYYTRLLYEFESIGRNDIDFTSNTSTYSILLKIKEPHSFQIKKRIRMLSPSLENIIQILGSSEIPHFHKNLDEKSTYIEIHCPTDKWFGDYGHFAQVLLWLCQYAEDIQILISEMYENWIDHFQSQDGLSSYCRYYGKDDTLESKLSTYEEIALKNCNNLELNKIISKTFETYGRVNHVNPDSVYRENHTSMERLIKALQYNPENIEALVSYGIILYSKSNYIQSKKQFETAVQIDNDLPIPHYYLGKILLLENNTALAEQSFQTLYTIQSVNIDILDLKIDAFKVLREIAFTKPETLHTTIGDIESRLSELYRLKTNLELEHTQKINNSSYAQQELKNALDQCIQKLKETPKNVSLVIELGHCHYHLNAFEKAVTAYKKALRIGTPQEFDVTLWLATSLLYEKKANEAQLLLNTALDRMESPQRKAILLGSLAWLYMEEGDKTKASMHLEKAMDLNKDYCYLWYLKAILLTKKGAHDMALECIAKTILLDVTKRSLLQNEKELDTLKSDIRFWDLVLKPQPNDSRDKC